MYVVEVIPVAKVLGQESYSYFSSVSYDRGTVIDIPIRNRLEVGIVISSEPVSVLKTALRAATFSLRKIPPQANLLHLSPTFLELADRIAAYEAISIGAAFSALLPKTGSIALAAEYDGRFLEENMLAHEPELYAAQTSERYVTYQGIIREAFAAGTSVLLVVPTIVDSEYAKRTLSLGIEDYVVTLSSNTKAHDLERAEKKITEMYHPLLIITTPAFGFLERRDIKTSILERSRARSYKSQERPTVNYKHALAVHAKLHARRLIIGDTLPSTDDEAQRRDEQYIAYETFPKRLALPGSLKVIAQKKSESGTEQFKLFSDELVASIKETIAKRGRVFLYAARRGMAPVVGCIDCGYILRDPESGSPLSLHRVMNDGIEERWLISATSGYREKARDVCPNCSSWRLRERGIGIQHVETEFRTLLPDIPLIVFDHTTANTPKKAEKLHDIFYSIHSQVLLGTTLALPYLDKPVSASAIVSLDSLLAIPSWRQQEEAFGIVLALREKTKGPVWVQARHRSEDNLLQYAARADLEKFYDEELAVRKEFKYPPFSVFIHLSYRGTKETIETTDTELKTLFEPYGLTLYGGTAEEHEKSIRQGLIRVPRSKWPHEDIVAKLRSLPPAIKVEINPDRII